MKLFRRIEPKSTHRHAKALGHLANAHAALMKERAEEAQAHIGRAFQAVSASLPKQAPAPNATTKRTAPPPTIAPGNDIGTAPKGLSALRSAATRMNTPTP
jgi:hypothetical protein